ncbi:hypothetical protein J5X84_02415 [Streptosporangiaceae bacterium NEAU-GS5]|nr:hypothetical protein [Streptosporangiaceae bacterium NEAU-GS5]
MPPRTNDFQAAVYFIQTHIAGTAHVTESAMLLDSMINKKREVDVLVEAEVTGKTLRIGIECTAGTRKANLLWVEGMWAKHQCLPTNHVVLVASAGFTQDAERKARLYHMEPVTPGKTIPEDGPLASLLRSEVELREIECDDVVDIRGVIEHDGDDIEFPLGLEVAVFRADGSRFATLEDVVRDTETYADEHELRDFVRNAQIGATYRLAIERTPSDWYLREATDPPRLLPLKALKIAREVRVRARPLPLTHGTLEDTGYAHGTGQLADSTAFVVLTEGPGGSQMSVRLTTPEGAVTDWTADRETQTLIRRAEPPGESPV